jgi:hypothetical protein
MGVAVRFRLVVPSKRKFRRNPSERRSIDSGQTHDFHEKEASELGLRAKRCQKISHS